MRKLILTQVFLMISVLLFAQKNKIPRETRKSPELLSNYLTANCTSDRQKVDSIYAWVINNIDYDYDAIQSGKPLIAESAETVLKRKKTICNGYVELLLSMLDVQGIKAERIEGYTRDYDPGVPYILVDADHAWIAIQLDGTWKLADPTWDAGYIGRIPKKEKTYPKRWDRERTFKKEKKRVKWENKIEKKKKDFDERMKDRDPFTDKIGFVRDTSLDNYLIASDTFLLTHLPEVPKWQLREHTLSIEQFCQPKDSVRQALSHPEGETLNYNLMIDEYVSKNIVEKWLYNAENGFDYNEFNHGLKAVNYYNSVGIFLDTELKKMIRKFPEVASRPIWEELIPRADTAIVHAKLASKQVKNMDKEDRSFYKSTFKDEASSQKDINKESEKLSKEVNKIGETIQSLDEKLKSDLEYVAPRLSKYQIYRDRFPEKGEPDPSTRSKEVQEILDEFNVLCARADSVVEKLNSYQDNSGLQGLMDHIVEADYHNRYANAYVSAFSISVSTDISEHDSIAVNELRLARAVLEDSVENELLPKDLINSVKDIERYVKSQLKEMEVLAEQGKASDLRDYERMLWAQYHERLENCEKKLRETYNHQIYIDRNLSVIEKGIAMVENSAKNLEDTREKREEHLFEELEINAERGKKLYEQIQNDATAWKKEMKRKLKE